MSLESDLYTRMTAHAGLHALLAGRVYPSVMAQNGALPAIAYQRISTQRESVMGSDTGDMLARVQFSIFSKTMDGAEGTLKVFAQLRAALQRYSGGGIQDIFIEDESHDFIDGVDLHRIIVDLRIWFKE